MWYRYLQYDVLAAQTGQMARYATMHVLEYPFSECFQHLAHDCLRCYFCYPREQNIRHPQVSLHLLPRRDLRWKQKQYLPCKVLH